MGPPFPWNLAPSTPPSSVSVSLLSHLFLHPQESTVLEHINACTQLLFCVSNRVYFLYLHLCFGENKVRRDGLQLKVRDQRIREIHQNPYIMNLNSGMLFSLTWLLIINRWNICHWEMTSFTRREFTETIFEEFIIWQIFILNHQNTYLLLSEVNSHIKCQCIDAVPKKTQRNQQFLKVVSKVPYTFLSSHLHFNFN